MYDTLTSLQRGLQCFGCKFHGRPNNNVRSTPPLPARAQSPPPPIQPCRFADAPSSGSFAAKNSKSPKTPTPAPTPALTTCWNTLRRSRSGSSGAPRRWRSARRWREKWRSIFIRTRFQTFFLIFSYVCPGAPASMLSFLIPPPPPHLSTVGPVQSDV